MLSKIKDIDPLQLTDVSELRSVLLVLMNVVEEQSKAIDELKRENGELKDTITRMKGGNARPIIRPSAKVGQDISSGGQEKGPKKFKKYADKAPVSSYEFIHDRVAQENAMPSLSNLIYNKPGFTPTF